ncbi:MAG: autotransporter domain-containing protein [Xanthomonadales bacterium PRO7]|nr:autotransporter domain-containing protein [Xanthomonadales bacterium PRO7]
MRCVFSEARQAICWLLLIPCVVLGSTATQVAAQSNNPYAPTLAYVGGNNQTGSPNATLPQPLAAALKIKAGSDGGSITIVWQVLKGSATIVEGNGPRYDDSISLPSGASPFSLPTSVHVVLGQTPGPVLVRAFCNLCATQGGDPYIQDYNLTTMQSVLQIVSGNNQSGPAGTSASAPLTVQLTSNGVPVANQSIAWTVSSGQATLGATSSISDGNGNASITFTYGTAPGPLTIQASVGGSQVTFNASAYAPAVNAISGSSQTGQVGTTLQPFVVQIGPAGSTGSGVQSSSPAALGGIAVTWSVLQGGGSLASSQTVTDASGRTSNTLTLGTNPGTNLVQATVAGAGSITFSAIAIPKISSGSTVFTIVSGNNQALVPNQPSQPLVVKLASTDGTAVPGAVIQWSVTGATGSLANANTPTGADGTAQNTLTVVLPGSYTVSAQIAGISSIPPLSFTFSNGVGNLPGLSPAQSGVANTIDKACPALATANAPLTPQQKDFLQRCSELVIGSGSNPQQVPDALDAMLNNKALPQRAMAQGVQQGQFDNLNTRFAELRQGASGFSAGGLTFNLDGHGLPLAMLGDLFRKDPANSDEVGKDFSRWGFFATGMIERGGFDATALRPGFDYHNASLTAGVDYRFTDSFVAGAAFGYNQNNSSFDANAGKTDVNAYSLNGYFSWYRGDWYVEGSLIYDKLDFDLSRNITYQIASLSGGTTTVAQTALASPSGDQNSFSLSAGRDFNRKAWTFSPYLRGVYSHTSLDGFSETMSDPNAAGAGLGTSVASRSMDSMLGVAGARVSYTMSTDWGVLVPNAVVEWNHEFRNDPQTVVVRFLADPTQTPISLTDKAPDSNYFNLGLGLNAVFAQGRSAYVYYEHMAGRAGAHADRLSVGIRIEF